MAADSFPKSSHLRSNRPKIYFIVSDINTSEYVFMMVLTRSQHGHYARRLHVLNRKEILNIHDPSDLSIYVKLTPTVGESILSPAIASLAQLVRAQVSYL